MTSGAEVEAAAFAMLMNDPVVIAMLEKDEIFSLARAALEAAELVRSKPEGGDELIRLRAMLRTCKCPRPANAAPDYITVDECIKRRECGCDLGDAVGAGDEAYRRDEQLRLDRVHAGL